MRTIHKYPIMMNGVSEHYIPARSRFLHFQAQVQALGTNDLFAWFEVDTDNDPLPRTLAVFGTGDRLPAKQSKAEWVATCQDGPFIWHLYEMF